MFIYSNSWEPCGSDCCIKGYFSYTHISYCYIYSQPNNTIFKKLLFKVLTICNFTLSATVFISKIGPNLISPFPMQCHIRKIPSWITYCWSLVIMNVIIIACRIRQVISTGSNEKREGLVAVDRY